MSVGRQSKNWLKALPTIQCTTLLLLNQCARSAAALLVSMASGERLQQTQKGASIPDSSSCPHLSGSLSFWVENNILGTRFSILKKRFAPRCPEVALTQGEGWPYEPDLRLARRCSHCRRRWVLCFTIFPVHILRFIWIYSNIYIHTHTETYAYL